jgi:hypothetical protein
VIVGLTKTAESLLKNLSNQIHTGDSPDGPGLGSGASACTGRAVESRDDVEKLLLYVVSLAGSFCDRSGNRVGHNRSPAVTVLCEPQ